MNEDFDDINIVHQIGIETNSIKLLCKKIRTINGKRPPANRKTQSASAPAEKLLEVIFTTSKHFSEQATVEYNSPAATRRFQNAATGELNFAALEAHYQPKALVGRDVGAVAGLPSTCGSAEVHRAHTQHAGGRARHD